MKVQCACGGAFVGWSKRAWLHWMDHHVCSASIVSSGETSEDDDEEVPHDSGYPAQIERSWQDNSMYDGEYRYIPAVQARQPIGFAVE